MARPLCGLERSIDLPRGSWWFTAGSGATATQTLVRQAWFGLPRSQASNYACHRSSGRQWRYALVDRERVLAGRAIYRKHGSHPAARNRRRHYHPAASAAGVAMDVLTVSTEQNLADWVLNLPLNRSAGRRMDQRRRRLARCHPRSARRRHPELGQQ